MKGKAPINTAAKLARLLRSEGWTDHLASECDRYIHGTRALSVRQLGRLKEIEAALVKVTGDMPTEQRMILGRFIALHKGIAFEAGLRTGLGVRVHQMGEPLSPETIQDALFPVLGARSSTAVASYHALLHGNGDPAALMAREAVKLAERERAHEEREATEGVTA